MAKDFHSSITQRIGNDQVGVGRDGAKLCKSSVVARTLVHDFGNALFGDRPQLQRIDLGSDIDEKNSVVRQASHDASKVRLSSVARKIGDQSARTSGQVEFEMCHFGRRLPKISLYGLEDTHAEPLAIDARVRMEPDIGVKPTEGCFPCAYSS